MKCALLLVAVPAVLACNSTVPNSALGEFSAPTGSSATGAGDRDLLFIANSGRDGLRALQLCNAPLLDNGNVNPADTCPPNVNGQFIPAPIRVFPATIETGHRPIRVAGVRLRRADGSAAGVALAAGTDSTVAVVDARSLVETQVTPGAVPKEILHLDIGARTIDVIAANPIDTDLDVETAAAPGAPVTAFVATTSELLVLDVGLDGSGSAQLPTIRGRCDLAPVVPTRIAVVPGSPDLVYVADGAGDGVVSILTSSISGGPCAMHRISAGGRSVRSVAVSPRWYDGNGPAHGPGDLLMMVVNPLPTPEPGRDLDPGGVVFAGTGTDPAVPEGILPVPHASADTTTEPMQPLSLPGAGLMLEGAFLRSVQARPAPKSPDIRACTQAPCTPLYVGTPSTAPTHNYSLIAVATATDGGSYFFEVPNRRFVNANLFGTDPSLSIAPLFGTPVFSAPNAAAPVMLIDPSTAEPGVTHNANWRAIWHSPIPGLDRRGGTVTTSDHGTLLFTPALTYFAPWQSDPAIALAPGDVVSFGTYTAEPVSSAACQDAVSRESAYRFELPILAIVPGTPTQAGTLELGEIPDSGAAVGFHPEAPCTFGAVAEVRTGGAQPWLVFEGSTAKGRVQPDNTFVARQRRFDYPRSTYEGFPAPVASSDVAFTFSIIGTNTIPRSGFSWTVASGQAPVGFNDSVAVAVGGLATAVTAYSSPRVQNLVFTSITGGNEVLQADPSLLASNLVLGLVAYR